MNVKKLTLNNFMLFENAEINWAKNINVICGENSTGKTTLLKVLYSVLKPLSKGSKTAVNKEMEEQLFVSKLQGVFRPDEMKIGRLVKKNKAVAGQILKFCWIKIRKYQSALATARKIMRI